MCATSTSCNMLLFCIASEGTFQNRHRGKQMCFRFARTSGLQDFKQPGSRQVGSSSRRRRLVQNR